MTQWIGHRDGVTPARLRREMSSARVCAARDDDHVHKVVEELEKLTLRSAMMSPSARGGSQNRRWKSLNMFNLLSLRLASCRFKPEA